MFAIQPYNLDDSTFFFFVTNYKKSIKFTLETENDNTLSFLIKNTYQIYY